MLNAIAVLIMVTSGWRIYNASPIFGFEFPSALTLGGWLAGALLWHFAAMWLLVVNGYLNLPGCKTLEGARSASATDHSQRRRAASNRGS